MPDKDFLQLIDIVIDLEPDFWAEAATLSGQLKRG